MSVRAHDDPAEDDAPAQLPPLTSSELPLPLVADGPVRYRYDALGRHVRTDEGGRSVRRSYDPAGNTERIGGMLFHHEEDPETGDALSNRLMAHSTPSGPHSTNVLTPAARALPMQSAKRTAWRT